MVESIHHEEDGKGIGIQATCSRFSSLIFAILVQSLAIIFIYENPRLLTTNSNTANDNEVVEIVTNASTSIAVPHNDNDS